MELAQRATYRGQVTRFAKGAKEYILSSVENTDHAVVLEELQNYKDRLNAAHENLNHANSVVFPLIDTDQHTKEAEAVAEYFDKAVEALSRLNYHIKRRLTLSHESEMPWIENQSRGNMASFNNGNFTKDLQIVKLPKIELKKFSGKFSEWIPFWEQFRTAVHENPTVSGVVKFNYMQSALTGKAAATIDGLVPSQASYDNAISLLREEYGNNDRLIDFYMKQLMNIRPVSSENDVSGLRKLHNSLVSFIRSLSSLGIPLENYHMMLKSVIMRSLPVSLRIAYHRTSKSDDNSIAVDDIVAENSTHPNHTGTRSDTVSSVDAKITDKTIRDILMFIKREVCAMEKSFDDKVACDKSKSSYDEPSTAAGLLTSKFSELCAFCKSASHLTGHCDADMTVTQRKAVLKTDGRCYRCAGKYHISAQCTQKHIMCEVCKGHHITPLCWNSSKQRPSERAIDPFNPDQNRKVSSLFASETRTKNVYLQTASVYASAPNRPLQLTVRIVLDGGSEASFVSKDLSTRLCLPVIGQISLSVLPFGSTTKPEPRSYNRVRISLRSRHTNERVCIEAIEVEDICVDLLPGPSGINKSLVGLKLADNEVHDSEIFDNINVLVGADNYWAIVKNKRKKIAKGLMAVDTKFGWTVHGAMKSIADGRSRAILHVSTIKDSDCMKNFWNLELLGIRAQDNGPTELVTNINVIKRGIRYQVSLPWKDSEVKLCSNEIVALQRLEKLTRRLKVNRKLFDAYNEAIQDLISNGIAEPVSAQLTDARVYYMPHQAVYREDKDTTKLRVVFDASSHALGATSLNDNLLTGENLVPEMLAVLLNFRMGKYAVTADIEKAFLQMQLDEKDRDSHRFMWYDVVMSPQGVLRTYRMTRVTFGVKCSPFMLGTVIRHHLEQHEENYPFTCEVLRKSFYVDDLVTSLNNLSDAKRLYSEAKVIMLDAGMNLRKWQTNDEDLRIVYQGDYKDMIKVLGVKWYILADEIGVNVQPALEFIEAIRICSKRSLLQAISKIFDPIGLLTPFIIRMKILMQDIWRLNLGWDDKMPLDMENKWRSWCLELGELATFTVPRFVKIEDLNNTSQRQLHIFADASNKAYGIVAYVREEDDTHGVTVRMLCSKGRVAPLKMDGSCELTLPKLEQTAALLAARMAAYITSNLSIDFGSIYLWSDSKITIYWIRGRAEKWKPYVSNRVREIQALTSIDCWRHCPGKVNPADLVTRGVSAKSLSASKMWVEGPEWLYKTTEFWPNQRDDFEERLTEISLSILLLPVNSSKINYVTSICNMEDFSSLTRLLRVTVMVIRFIKRKCIRPTGTITSGEMDNALNYWVGFVQSQHYPHEVDTLKRAEKLDRRSSLLSLNPMLDINGIMRVTGRLHRLSGSQDVIHPIILPKQSWLSSLIILEAHQTLFHGGTNFILSHVRKRFWIIRMRQLIKAIISRCVKCKKLHAQPAKAPFAPLPKERLIASRPFQTVGVDFAGPLYVKYDDTCGENRKVYIMLVTCAVVRAVHLELVSSMSTESCISAFKRFIGRRGIPAVVYSDNAKTFKRTTLEIDALQENLRAQNLQEFIAQKGIEWRFIVERAAWWGGFWERLIRTMKDALKISIGKRRLSFEQLQTLLVEIEATINSRPLTYISEEPDDLQPLTPAHFLAGYSSLIFNNPAKETIKSTRENIIHQWRCRGKLILDFWKRWKHEYLCQLRTAHHVPNCTSQNIRIGDVVLIHNEQTPRIQWKLAIVTNVFEGRDKQVRACEVRMSNGSTLRRVIQHLYPLEIDGSKPDRRAEDEENMAAPRKPGSER